MKFPKRLTGVCVGIMFSFFLETCPAKSQIIPDNSLLKKSIVRPNCTNCLIQGGSQKGQNLFHSFKEFSIPLNGEAHFDNSSNVSLIISRVTGGLPTNIQGSLRANYSADLFLLNPNGIIFGPQANLQIGGSFLGTTANSILFSDGTKFSASNPETSSILTVSIPIGLQFGEKVGDITNSSQHSEIVATPGFPPLPFPVGLKLQDEKTLALVGGNIALSNGKLTAPAGKIEVGSVGSFSEVEIHKTVRGWDFDFRNVNLFQDIFSSDSTLNVNDFNRTRGGKIEVSGRQISLTDNSALIASNFGVLDGGEVSIEANEVNILSGSAIIASAFEGGSDAGGVNILAKDSIVISGISGNSVSRIASDSFGPGNAGSIVVSTKKLVLQNGGRIIGNSLSSGNSGNIQIFASESVFIDGIGVIDNRTFPSGLFTISRGSGEAGNIEVNTPTLFLNNRAEIGVSSLASGKAGIIKVEGSSIHLDNLSQFKAEASQGQGGNIFLTLSDFLFMRGGSAISANAGSDIAPGNGGNITIIADDVVAQPNTNSDIFATSFGGKGGVISITARENFFGFEETSNPNPRDSNVNDISVQSTDPDPQLSGQVNITTGEIDPSENLPEQPENVEPPQEIAKGCRPGQTLGNSSFIHVGRGGLPIGPHQTQTPTTVWQDLRAHNLQSSPTVATDSPLLDTTPTSKIIEAKGWSKDLQGRIHLTANVPQPSLSPQPIATC